MLQESYTAQFPGFEQMTVGMREIVCECGCGQTFFQTKVGRARKYLNAQHKRAAYKNQPAKPPIVPATELAFAVMTEWLRAHVAGVEIHTSLPISEYLISQFDYLAGADPHALECMAWLVREIGAGRKLYDEMVQKPTQLEEEDIPF